MTEDRLAFPTGELRGRTARGGVLNALFLGGGQLLIVLQGLIVTALLGPVAIGLYGIVTTTAMTFVELKRVGVDEAFVQQSEIDQPSEYRKAFTVELGLGLACSLAIAICAPIIAWAYGEPKLLPLTLAVAYLPTVFALHAPLWIFFRRMDFLRLRLLSSIVPVGTFLVTVPLAALGVGVWSLVIGPLVANTVLALVAQIASPFRLGIDYERAAVRRYLRFVWPIFAATGALVVIQQGQLIAFDSYDGIAAVGFITFAYTLTRFADRADQIVTQTIYPAICAVRDRTKTLEELFEKSNRLTLVWVFPFAALFVLFSEDLVDNVLGSEWEPSIVLLQGLGVAAALQQLGYNWYSFYRARGNPGPQAVEAAFVVGGFLVLAVPGLLLWGFWGFVAGRVVGGLVVVAVRRVYVRRLLPGARFVYTALRALVPVVLGALPVLALRFALWGGERSTLQAIAELALFLAVTGLATWALERNLLGELRTYMRRDTAGTQPAMIASEVSDPV